MAGEQPKRGTHLLIGRGPYNQLLAVTPHRAHRELGNIVVIAPPRQGTACNSPASHLGTFSHRH
jgi:hypothetical protein